MVINGGARGGAGKLAAHLQRTDTNERMELLSLRGVLATGLDGALHEMEAVASGARSKRHFYHANIDSRMHEELTEPQKDRSIELLGEKLGLSGQPCAVVEHVKNGRHHLHVVWSRIDLDTMKAIPDSHNFRIHEEVARQLEREFGFEHTQGAHIGRDGLERPKRTPSHDDQQMAARTEIDPKQLRAHVAELFHAADGGKAFAAALDAEGLTLAQGDKRNVLVIVDAGGGTHALNKAMTGLTAAETRKRLVDLDAGMLPGVEEAREVAKSRQLDRQADHERAEAERVARINELTEASPFEHTPDDFSEAEAERAMEAADEARLDDIHSWEYPSPDSFGLGVEPLPPRKPGLDAPELAAGRTASIELKPTHAPENAPGEAFQAQPDPEPVPELKLPRFWPGVVVVSRFLDWGIKLADRIIETCAELIGNLFESKPEPPAPAPEPSRRPVAEPAPTPPPEPAARPVAPQPKAPAPEPEKSPTEILLERIRARQLQPPAPPPELPRDREYRLEFGPRKSGDRRHEP